MTCLRELLHLLLAVVAAPSAIHARGKLGRAIRVGRQTLGVNLLGEGSLGGRSEWGKHLGLQLGDSGSAAPGFLLGRGREVGILLSETLGFDGCAICVILRDEEGVSLGRCV